MATTAAGVRMTSYTNSSNKKGSKNPYRDLGHDEFSALLVEIEEKKQKIISEVDPERVSLVRFVHSEDNKLKPIVFLSKGKKELDFKSGSLDRAAAAAAGGTDARIVTKVAPIEGNQHNTITAPAAAAVVRQPMKQLIAQSRTYNDVTVRKISKNSSKNPFTNLGLEAFTAVLEELQEKKRKILSSYTSPEEVSHVIFFYSQDNRLKAIVVNDKGKTAKVMFDSNGNQHKGRDTKIILNKETVAETADDKDEDKKERSVTEPKVNPATKEEVLHEPTSAVATKDKDVGAALVERKASEEAKLDEFKLEAACEKTRVYATYAYDHGCAIVILLLVVSFLALYQKYKSTVQLLEQHTRFC